MHHYLIIWIGIHTHTRMVHYIFCTFLWFSLIVSYNAFEFLDSNNATVLSNFESIKQMHLSRLCVSSTILISIAKMGKPSDESENKPSTELPRKCTRTIVWLHIIKQPIKIVCDFSWSLKPSHQKWGNKCAISTPYLSLAYNFYWKFSRRCAFVASKYQSHMAKRVIIIIKRIQFKIMLHRFICALFNLLLFYLFKWALICFLYQHKLCASLT